MNYPILREDDITYEEAHEVFEYRDGKLFWKKDRSYHVKAGMEAGCNASGGYRRIVYKQRRYQTHRLVWLWHHGYLPEDEIDHVNRNRSDNRIENLQIVNRSRNMQNISTPGDNSSGIKGVRWNRSDQRWRAQIKINNKYQYLGNYEDLAEAVLARLTAEICSNWQNCISGSPAYRFAKRYNLINNTL